MQLTFAIRPADLRTVLPDLRSPVYEGDIVSLARRGALLLDEKAVRVWYEMVDLDILDIKNPYRCVLAQIYGSFEDGMRSLFGPGRPFALRLWNEQALRHGFDIFSRAQAQALEGAWRDEIMNRRATARLQDRI